MSDNTPAPAPMLNGDAATERLDQRFPRMDARAQLVELLGSADDADMLWENEEITKSVAAAYSRGLAHTLLMGSDKVRNRELGMETHRQRLRNDARDALTREKADAAFERPPYRTSLVEEFLEPVEAPAARITRLSFVGHNVLLAAKAKAGKSTLILSLIRSLADGDPFLGSLDVTPPVGHVGYINYEMSQSQMNQWLRDAGVQNPERVAVLHLRGYSLPLLGETAQDFYVEWAKGCGVEVLIADPWGRMMVGSGSENSNDDVRAVLGILGEIKRRAGIADLFVAAHMGHAQAEIGQERARGASELLGWPDALWNLNKVAETRFLSATGRDIDFTEQSLVYDPDSRSMTLDGGTTDRATAKATAAEAEVVKIVAAKPGQLTTKVQARMTSTTQRTARTEAVRCAVESGRIRVEKVGAAKLLYPAVTATMLPWEPTFEATP